MTSDSYTGRLELTWTNKHKTLLAHEDQVVVVVGADVELDPGDGAGEPARLGCVVVADW
jgi:hypothetical protein